MLKYNFDRIFRARGIDKPSSYLVKAGFSRVTATKINRNQVARLNLNTLERLCLLLKCSPSDFFEWIPEKHLQVDTNHPLNNLRRSDKELILAKMINAIPYNQLEEIEQMIQEKIKND